MATIKEEAMSYQAPEKMNAADLDYIDVSWELKVIRGRKQETGEEFTYKAYVEGNKEYYVANSVLEQIKSAMSLKPELTKFKVRKSGSGLATKYKVEPLI